EEFVAEDVTLLHLRNGTAIQVQVGAADGRGGDPQNDVVILKNGRIRYRFDADIMTAVVSKCAHALLLWLDQGWWLCPGSESGCRMGVVRIWLMQPPACTAGWTSICARACSGVRSSPVLWTSMVVG